MKDIGLRLSLLAAAAAAFLALPAGAAAAEFDKYAVESVSASLSSVQAGAHADMTVSFGLTAKEGEPYALTRDVLVALPPGLIGNPQNLPRCTTLQLGTQPKYSECPVDSQVGVNELVLGGGNAGAITEPIYNMPAPGGDNVARLGFFAGPYPIFIDIRVDPVDYGLVAAIEGAPAAASFISAQATLWGVPAAPAHDALRITPTEGENNNFPPGGRSDTLPEAPFLTNPTGCTTPRAVSVTATSYQLPASPSTLSAPFPAIGGCGKLNFEPSLTVTPTSTEAAAPTGIDADLKVPQDETPQGRGTSQLRRAVVTLPPGMTINPAAGAGLEACSAAQVGFETNAAAHCPDAAKIGSAEFDVPALEGLLHGAVYQRTPEPGHLFRFWLVSDELGVHLKLPAEIEADPLTGQLTTVFDGVPALGGNPQVPVSELRLHVFGGPRAPLSTPAACGTYQTHYVLSPWSGTPAVEGDTGMQVSGSCGKGGFAPRLSAGTLDPSAGAFSAFTLELTREDGEANPRQLEVTLPQGLLAELAGVTLCPDDAAAVGACPAASRVGTVAVAAGVGSLPLWIPQPGKAPTAVYLSGPYEGAPYSLAIVVPAQAGPFDLGTVVTHARIEVDPETAVARIVSDPLPQILEGVPVAYRAIHVDVDRPEFTLNPTSCDPARIVAAVTASNGVTARPEDGFQAVDCATLGFAPKLRLRLSGGTGRGAHPALRAELTMPKGGANVAKAVVDLPHSEFLAQAHIQTVCTRVQYAAAGGAGAGCPPGSVYGRAKAWSPLLDAPLEGNVYLRSNGGERALPDLVASLDGPIHLDLVGYVGSSKQTGGLRTSFATVPDAPVSRFVLTMPAGKRSLLENSTDLCTRTLRAVVRMRAHNGKAGDSRPRIETAGCGRRRVGAPKTKRLHLSTSSSRAAPRRPRAVAQARRAS